MDVRIETAAVSFEHWGERVRPFSGLSLEIKSGEWVMLAGPNGSGKTTLLRVFAGTQRLESGTVSLWGKDPSTVAPAARAALVYAVTQNPLLGTATDLTAFENLYIADGCPRTRRNRLADRYAAVLAPLGLELRLDRRLTTLSGGERQLLALAIASLRPARLILLDEPLAALDPGRAQSALDCIGAMWKSGKTMIQVAHDSRLIATIGTRTVVLANGRIVYDELGSRRSDLLVARAAAGLGQFVS